MKALHIILVGMGAFGFIWFALPLLAKRILNIGNGTGMAVFLILFFYGVFLKNVNTWIMEAWNKKTGRVGLIVQLFLTTIILVIVIVETICMMRAAAKGVQELSMHKTQVQENNSDEKKSQYNTTIIVLGCKVYGETPSLMLEERLKAAESYLKENIEVVCILSGGQGDDETISEAECMYRYLVDAGIDASRLYKEDQSTSTRENILFSMQIMEENGLGTQAAIVTNEFHEYRAAKIAEEAGLEVYSIPARTAGWLLPTYYVRELYGILYQWIR